MDSKIVVCPICGKKTLLRIQNGEYLPEYPIRVSCINCMTLLKGVYIMNPMSRIKGLNMINANVRECLVDPITLNVADVDYIAEISGELPCRIVRLYEGGLPKSPYFETIDNLDEKESVQERKKRFEYFANNMFEWKKTKSTAFQLLDDGSIDYIAKAINNKMGEYLYECDNYLKSMQCLQEIVLEETKYLFIEQSQDECVRNVIKVLSKIDREKLKDLINHIGGVQGLIVSYRKVIEVFSNFMNIYPNLLPAETFMRFKKGDYTDISIATCTFNDIKSYYQDAYESLLALLYVPVGLDNIILRGNVLNMDSIYDDVFPKNKRKDFNWYKKVDNGTKINKLNEQEVCQRMLHIPANRLLRNGIGHNNIEYNGITQVITAYDLKKPHKINYRNNLMGIAVDCIGLVKSAIILSEMILFLLRIEFKKDNVRSIMHPRFYNKIEVNEKCPCGSGLKYKKCCMNEVEEILHKKV